MLQDRRLVGWDSTAISTQIWLHRAITALIYKLVRGAARRKPDRRPQSADQKTNCPQCRIEVRPTACYHPCSSVHSFVRIHILKTDAPQLKHDGGLLTLNWTLTRSLPTLYMTLTFPGDSWPLRMQKVKGQFVQKLDWKRTDRTDCTALPANAVRKM